MRLISQFYFLLLIIANLFINIAHASNPIPKFETTRMKSTAGAGIASILMDESTYLNPATIAFYNKGSIYYQKSGLDSTQGKESEKSSQSFSSSSIIVSDSKGSTGGSLSYNNIDYYGQNIKRFAASFARPIGKKSSLGITGIYTKEKIYNENGHLIKSNYKQTTIGVSHVIDESFSLGIVLYDPLKEKKGETLAMVGAQYIFGNFLSLMLDLGADYNQELSQTTVWRGATQIKIFSDFYARFGIFNDKGLKQKGSGIGVGWLQPKLVFEFALKNTELLQSDELKQIEEDIKETSFSLSYRF